MTVSNINQNNLFSEQEVS